MNLTLERAKELNKDHVTEESLVIHSLNVCYAMGAMAKHFGEDEEHWQAVGYLHDYDYQEFPEEHLQHTEKELLAQGVSEEDVRAIMAHGFEIVNDVEPKTNMEKSLFTVDALSVHDVLNDDDAPRAKRHNRQNSQDHNRRDVRLRKHLK